MLNSIINTPHLTLKLATIDDITILRKIYEEALHCYTFDPGYEITSPEVILRQGALPSNDMVNNSYIYTICINNHIIGYIEMYLGFPTTDNGYIPFLYITEAYKNREYAEEILASLTDAFSNQNYKTVTVSTSIQSWKHLVFWHDCGFDTILSVETDSANDNYGRMELQFII